MSIARHHAEWLSLLEISGPFLSMPVLLRAFPQGLDAHDANVFRDLKQAYAEWIEDQRDPAIHTAWVRFVLNRVLELPDEVIAIGQAIAPSLKATIAEHGETLRPDMVILTPGPSPIGEATTGEGSESRMLIQVYPPSQELEKPIADRRWKASPATRMMELLHACNVRLGLVTNGERWLLVDAPRNETTGFISWYAEYWQEESITLRAFRSLLSAYRFFSVGADETLVALLAESATDQQEVTDQLGYQVRRAVEVLIQAIDRADQDRGRTLLAGLDEKELYEAALTVMMRLVFLFSAEERGLLLLGDPLYDQSYAVSTLSEQLRETADMVGEEVLERRFDAWCRLLATFRVVHDGVQHPDLKLPAYGGSLFDPDRYPFLEGRAAHTLTPNPSPTGEGNPLPINNRVVLHLLEALQILQVKVPGGGPMEARRVSFRALDIEQIGTVYQGLLDHTAVRASEPVLGLIGTKDREPEVPLSALEADRAKDDRALIESLIEQTGRSEAALKRSLMQDARSTMQESGHASRTLAPVGSARVMHLASKLQTACGNDQALLARILPFAGLIRLDDFEQPMVILPGSVYVTAGTERRSTGTHYTPRSLTEPIVQRTLEPLVYVGPAEGLPRDQWRLRGPAEILALKICDMAMGSASFNVQADRYLADLLVESWEEYSRQDAKMQSENEGEILSAFAALREASPDDRLITARRLIAERCLYGVDKNPMAVEIAKLSMWLVTMAKDRPFTFLDHAFKCGDSLVGADEEMFERWAHGLQDAREMTLFDETLRDELDKARSKRRELESFVVNELRDAERKAALLAEAEAAMARVKLGCDLIIGTRLLNVKPKEKEARLNTLLIEFMAQTELTSPYAQEALEAAHKVRAFHWPFEFPEVFEQGGFSAFVGNPPFVGGRRIRETMGDEYREALYDIFPNSAGGADYCAFFFLRGFQMLRSGGTLGLIATNTIAQGDTRQTGLDTIVAKGGTLYAATNNMPWPGMAAVVVSIVHLIRGGMPPPFLLDDASVQYISSLLDSRQSFGEPQKLKSNENKSFQGSLLRGMGFVLEPEEAQALLKTSKRNAEVVQPFLNGENLNSNFDQAPNRWAINFFDWPLTKAETYKEPMRILKERVYPERMGNEENRKTYAKIWWQYWRPRSELYRIITPMKRVLAIALTSRTAAFAFMPTTIIFSHAVGVFAFDSPRYFSLLQSALHIEWAWKYGSSLKGDLRYTPSDIFETFPFPQPLLSDDVTHHAARTTLDAIGEQYHEHRRQIMLARQEGLTTTYNRFHDADERSADIARLRDLHKEMDRAVAAAYGWDDLALGHDLHQTQQGVRFTLSEAARREVLGRLLELNHQRYEEEQAAAAKDEGGGMKAEGKKTTKGRKKKSGGDEGTSQMGLL